MAYNINFFEIVTVDNSDFDGYTDWGFNSIGFLISLENGSDNDVVEYSFNGTAVHGRMKVNTITSALAFDNRVQTKIYFRKPVGPSASIDVRLEVWKR